MIDRKKVIKGVTNAIQIEERNGKALVYLRISDAKDILSLLKEHEIEEPHPWEHILDAPDYTFKGRCRNCGFIHCFIQGHDAQYRFCPQCGEQKVI